MNKRKITIILLISLMIGIISLYTTFAYNEELVKLEDSHADYNIIYSLQENSNKKIIVLPHEEKYVDINLVNQYEKTVKYGMYYYLENMEVIPENVEITLSPESLDLLENTIKNKQKRSISIKINNSSDKQLELTIGALVGFENGNISDLVKPGEVLIN